MKLSPKVQRAVDACVRASVPITRGNPKRTRYLFHVTYTGRLPGIAQHGLMPEATPSIGDTSFDSHRVGAIFLTADTGVDYWFERAYQWAFERGDPWEDDLVPVVLRVPRAELEPYCVKDRPGILDSGAEALKCRVTIAPATIQLWNGASWVPVRHGVDRIKGFDVWQSRDGTIERSLLSGLENPLLPLADEMSQA